jgi:phage internal scaffolding protein
MQWRMPLSKHGRNYSVAKEAMKFKTGYGDRSRVQIATVGESLTQQHHAHDADVRNIIKQYDRTGLIANVNRGVARYGDYSEINEYREALDLVIAANENFGELPAKIREMFGNDAGAFFEFASNPENAAEMVKLGLAEAPPVVEEAPKRKESPSEPPAPQEAGE